jgi:hypothetical protein
MLGACKLEGAPKNDSYEVYKPWCLGNSQTSYGFAFQISSILKKNNGLFQGSYVEVVCVACLGVC